MTIEKTVSVDQIVVNENGVINYREASRIVEDGQEIAKSYTRRGLIPGQDLADIPPSVVAICNTVWTPEVVAAYQASLNV